VKLLYLGIGCIASSLGKTFYLKICVALSKELKNYSRFYRFISAGKIFRIAVIDTFSRMDGKTFVPGDIVSLYLWEKHFI
jgi:hypothetical protein